MALTTEPGAYAGIAEVWAADVELAYGPLARHLLGHLPETLDGALALDAGAGSGVAGRELTARGARVVSADREVDMAAYVSGAGPAVAGDVAQLPFRADVFDVAVAAFVVNHLREPVVGLRELRRVTRRGGVVVVSTFSNHRDGAKEAIDEVAERHGFVQPAWYVEFRRCAQAVGDVAAVERALRAAGLTRWSVTEEAVDVGIATAADVVRYRLGMPHLNAFAVSLTPQEREAFVAEAVDAVARTGAGFAPRVVEAVAVV
ncbi:class I SAM-dependent methyltransferase [Nocardioides dilutus]